MPSSKPRRSMAELFAAEAMPGESMEAFTVRKKREYLVVANKQRKALKVLRHALRVGAIDDLELLKGNLREYEPVIASWRIEYLLRACHGIGATRSNLILDTMKVSPRRRVEQISYRQRKEMAEMVREVRQSWV